MTPPYTPERELRPGSGGALGTVGNWGHVDRPLGLSRDLAAGFGWICIRPEELSSPSLGPWGDGTASQCFFHLGLLERLEHRAGLRQQAGLPCGEAGP